jgi:hypothetical protein
VIKQHDAANISGHLRGGLQIKNMIANMAAKMPTVVVQTPDGSRVVMTVPIALPTSVPTSRGSASFGVWEGTRSVTMTAEIMA